MRPTPGGLPTDGSWLVKPISGSGGRGIEPWVGQPLPSRRRVYFQQAIAGPSWAAIYVGTAGRADLRGITRQLVGEPWLHAPPFGYAGSLWSRTLLDAPGEFLALGEPLARVYALTGVFGVDGILADGHPWAVEINPRYTASVEVVEWGTGQAIFHEVPWPARLAQGWIGKAIYFAPRPLTFPADGPWMTVFHDPSPFGPEPFADIPAPGTAIPSGAPVMTILEMGTSEEECLGRLKEQAAHLDRLLAAP